MSQPRLRLEGCTRENGVWHIGAEEAHHLIRVRRCYTGSVVEGLLNGEKIELKLECEGDSVTAREITRCREEVITPRIELLLGLLKNDQLDDALRFSAETGVYAVRLVVCERSVPRFEASKLADKCARWRRVLDEATKQAGAAVAPRLESPVPFSELNFEELPEKRLIAMLSPETKKLRDIEPAASVVLAIGPEGDWAPGESRRLLEKGFAPVTLGPRILRASTAVAAGCAGLGLLWGRP